MKEELQSFKQVQGAFKQELESFKESQEEMKVKMDNRFDSLEENVSYMQGDIAEIKKSIHRLEKNEPQNIMNMLKMIHTKIEDKDFDIIALNKRLFRVESAVEQLQNK